jgi:ribosomal protein S27AE
LTKFRYNLAKTCRNCGAGFIADIFEEKHFCSNCDLTAEEQQEVDAMDRSEVEQEVELLVGMRR